MLIYVIHIHAIQTWKGSLLYVHISFTYTNDTNMKRFLCMLMHSIYIDIIHLRKGSFVSMYRVYIHTWYTHEKFSSVRWYIYYIYIWYTHAHIRLYVDWTSLYPGACFHACLRACAHVSARVCRCTKRCETNLFAKKRFFHNKDFSWLACKRIFTMKIFYG